MGLLKKLRGLAHDDWCSQCQSQMDVTAKQLYALPKQMVGHYVIHEKADYYKDPSNMVPIQSKSQIPTGMYACGMHAYRCGKCGHRAVKLTVFLPVRDQEKVEQALYFDKGEMDDFAAGII